MTRTEAIALLEKYNRGEASRAEAEALKYWYIHEANRADAALDEEAYAAIHQDMWQVIALAAASGNSRKLWPRIRIAVSIAAAVAAIVFGVWFFSGPPLNSTLSLAQAGQLKDITPGHNGATITYSSGEVIQLDSAKSGVVLGSDLKYNDGTVVSDASSSRANARDLSNSKYKGSLLRREDEMTASTSKGQTYHFTLSDGTRVFLNADSKISFPAQFSGKERKISLTGEAYFEVVHNAKMPFRVESGAINGNSQVVEDIGTAFNINAYSDESSIKTTLVEGSAVLRHHAPSSARAEATTLSPNQQASLQNGTVQVKTINPEQAVSWRQGYFVFEQTRLDAIMRQISRWYNVGVRYEDEEAKALPFSGSASRYDNVSRILTTLSNTNVVKFEIRGNEIIVKR